MTNPCKFTKQSSYDHLLDIKSRATNWSNQMTQDWTNRYQDTSIKHNINKHKNTFNFLNLNKIKSNDLTIETYTFIFHELKNLVDIYFFENNKESTIVILSENGFTLFKVIYGQDLFLPDFDEYYVNFKKELINSETINPLIFLISNNNNKNDNQLNYKQFINILTIQKESFKLSKHNLFAESELVNIENIIHQVIDGDAFAFNAIFENNINPIKHKPCHNIDNDEQNYFIDNKIYNIISFPISVDNIYLWKVFVDEIILTDYCTSDNGIKIINKNIYDSEIILFSHNNPQLNHI
jgi:hypothetical protein